MTDKGSPELARTKEPTISRGSMVVARSASWATASVGAARTETIPVAGSILRKVRLEERPASMKLHTPANFNAPMKKNTAATAGMMMRNRSSAPSLADAKMVCKNLVFGVKRGSSESSTFLVSRYKVLESRKGTTIIGTKIDKITNGKALIPKTERAISPSTKVAKDCGD